MAVTLMVRLLPGHVPNFTPMGALALFTGVYLARYSKWWVLMPLAAMFASDLFIGFYEWRIMAAVYGGFLIYSLLGLIVSRYKNAITIFGTGALGAVLFYLVTNFAVWAFSGVYTLTLGGLIESYVLAIPFFRSTIIGDLVFTGLFFGAYEGAVWLLRTQKTSALLGALRIK